MAALPLVHDLLGWKDEVPNMADREVHDLGEGRYLILLWTGGRARRSGVELEGEIGNIVTLRDGKAERLEAYLGWDTVRKAAGLG